MLLIHTPSFALAALSWLGTPPSEESALLLDALKANPDAFGSILENADEHRLKIEVAVVVDGPDGPTLERHSIDRGPDYWYPASSVKTCAAIAAFVKLDRLGEDTGRPIDRDTPLRFLPLFDDETVDDADPSHLDGGMITAAHEARKVFLVSDNRGYNRLYELAGNDVVNDVMRDAGLSTCRIFHRLSEFRSPSDQLRVPAIELMDGEGETIASLPVRTSAFEETNADLDGISIGTGHTSGDQVVDGPMSFERKNYISLRDLQDMHVMLLRPDIAIDGASGFPISDGDRAFIAEAMASTPGESKDPVYDRKAYPDDFSKFLLPGLLRFRKADEVVVRDKVGRAYGFSTTNSEVLDARTGRTFFLAATIYTNPNEIVGDGVYGYATADRFFADLGEAVGRVILDAR